MSELQRAPFGVDTYNQVKIACRSVNMLAEVLLVLAGHPSAFFVPSPATLPSTFTVADSLADYLHPGEIASLNTLGQLALHYSRTRNWATSITGRVRDDVLAETLALSSRKGKGKAVDETISPGSSPGIYTSALAASILLCLRDYEFLIVEVEARVLSLDPGMVQDERGYVPLSTLVASFSTWQSRLAALANLVDRLTAPATAAGFSTDTARTPAQLMELLSELQHTGDPELAAVFTRCLAALHHLFLTHLASFVLYGLTSTSSSPTSPTLGLDAGPDPLSPQHRVYRLNETLLPRSVRHGTRDSILYVGRVAATLRREGRALPNVMIDDLREKIMAIPGLADGQGLDEMINRVRADIGEWLWRHVLTGPQIIEALEAFGNYFLTLRGEYTSQLVRELHRLQANKLLVNPSSSSAAIREQDLSLVLLRASVGTSAETDRFVEKLRLKLPAGAIRPTAPPTADMGHSDHGNTDAGLFASSVLGHPMVLSMAVSWPLDLFMTPPALKVYAEIHSYLLAIRDVHLRLQDAWAALTLSRRGGIAKRRPSLNAQEEEASQASWSLLRSMLFFIDQLERHFLSDVVDEGHRLLLAQLQAEDPSPYRPPSGASHLRDSTPQPAPKAGPMTLSVSTTEPTSPSTRSHGNFDAQTVRTAHTVRSSRVAPPRSVNVAQHDFLSLRTMHARHLAALRDGLLLTDRQTTIQVRDILNNCKSFAALVVRWYGGAAGGIPQSDLEDRLRQTKDVAEVTQDLLVDFFGLLVESQNPPTVTDETSSAGKGGDRSLSRTMRATQISRLISRQMSFGAGPRLAGADGPRLPGVKEPGSQGQQSLSANGGAGKHVEQLLLRLDWNDVLTTWRQDAETGGANRPVLAEGRL